MQYPGNILYPDPGTIMVDMADRALILLYSHIRKNSRRLIHLVVTLLPLMALLVGSCKTSELLPWAYSGNTSPEQIRMALFPDRVNFHDAGYRPAAGYISRARDFIVGQPERLMMLTQQEIGYLFGKPTLNRHDADAEVWQYKTGSCVVDLYFYDKDGTHGQNPLSYVDVRLKPELVPGSAFRTEPLSADEKSDCLNDVVGRQSFFRLHI